MTTASDRPLRAALYARVSTSEQTTDNQVLELRRYAEARSWTVTEYLDVGVSGAKDRRPALDRLMADALSRKVDVVLCWRLDRFGRNLRHLVVAIEELAAAGVAFVSLGESIDTASPTGRLLLGVLGSFAQFERERIRERVLAGLQRARRQGKQLGRPRTRPPVERLQPLSGASLTVAAERLGVSRSTVKRWRRQVQQGW